MQWPYLFVPLTPTDKAYGSTRFGAYLSLHRVTPFTAVAAAIGSRRYPIPPVFSAQAAGIRLTLAVSAAFRRSQYFDSPGRRTPSELSRRYPLRLARLILFLKSMACEGLNTFCCVRANKISSMLNFRQ